MTRLRMRNSPRYARTTLPSSPGAALLADYISRLTTAGGTLTSTRLTTLSTLLDTVASSGLGTKLTYCVLPGAPDTFTGHNVPLIDLLSLGVATSTYVSSEWNGLGLKGASKSLTSPVSPSTHLTSDDTHLSLYYNENKSAGFIVPCGAEDGSGALQFYGDGFLVCNQYSDNSDRTVEFVSPLAGLSMGSRLSSTLHQLRTPSGGGADSLANQSTNTRTGNLPATAYVLITTSVGDRILFTSVGAGITGPQYTALATALSTYTAARGA